MQGTMSKQGMFMCRGSSAKHGGVKQDWHGCAALFFPSLVEKGKFSKCLPFICEIVPACQPVPGAL